MWHPGDDLTHTYQIGQLQEKVSNISVELGNKLQAGFSLLMKDPTTSAQFADNGRYSNNNPPLDPNNIKNALAITLQTYLVSESMKQNDWYAIPLGISTKEEYDNRKNPPCMGDLHMRCPGEHYRDYIYWSPTSSRQYQLVKRGGGPATVLNQVSQWASLPLLFDGAYNCTALGQRDNPQLVHINFDGTLDISCISQFPILISCGAECPQKAGDGSCPFPHNVDCNPPKRGLLMGGGDTVRQGDGKPVGNPSPPPKTSPAPRPYPHSGPISIHRRALEGML
ncbi:MAG: hypothetical protein Q9166_008151 [cf. Caloplaca sp. 2 TL-2023]